MVKGSCEISAGNFSHRSCDGSGLLIDYREGPTLPHQASLELLGRGSMFYTFQHQFVQTFGRSKFLYKRFDQKAVIFGQLPFRKI